MTRRAQLLLLASCAVLAAGAALYYRQLRSTALEVTVAGGDGGGLPLAQPVDERFDAAALEALVRDPAAAGLEALVVMRHGHVVFQRFGHGLHADSVVDSGPFASVLVALLAGAAVQDGVLSGTALGRFDPQAWRAGLERATQLGYPELLSRKVWSRINAASAWIAPGPAGNAVPVDCCFHARLQDWMRVAALIAADGRFEGTQLIGRDWVLRMRQPVSVDREHGLGLELAAAAHGAHFEADDLVFLRGPGRWRLWISPGLGLAVLFGARADLANDDSGHGDGALAWDEARLPNRVIETIIDRTAAQKSDSLLQQLVPHH